MNMFLILLLLINELDVVRLIDIGIIELQLNSRVNGSSMSYIQFIMLSILDRLIVSFLIDYKMIVVGIGNISPIGIMS